MRVSWKPLLQEAAEIVRSYDLSIFEQVVELEATDRQALEGAFSQHRHNPTKETAVIELKQATPPEGPVKALAEEKFREINEAYEAIKKARNA